MCKKESIKKLFFNIFQKHPKEKNMSYLSHMTHALSIVSELMLIIFVLIVHSIFPGVWETKASDMIEILNHKLSMKRKDIKKEE